MTAADRRAGPAQPHPDLDTLADLDAGALTDAQAGPVRAHAAGCARCTQVLTALGGVRADLRALPTPSMPPAVAARLDAVFADLRAAPPADRRPAPADRRPAAVDLPPAAAGRRPAPVADLGASREARAARADRQQRRGQRWRVLGGTAAAAVALVVAGASITSLVKAGSGSDDSAAGGGGTALDQQTTRREQESAAAPGAAAAPTTLPPLPDFDRSSLAAALPSLTTAYAVGRVVDDGTAGPAGAMADPAQRTACIRAIPGAAGEVTAVRWIRYAGRPAYVLIFEDAGVRTAYVVGDQCGRVPAVPATVLDTVR